MQNLNKIWIFSLAWWLIWMAFHAIYLIQSGWNYEIACAESLISNVLLAGICSGVLFSVQYNQPDSKRMMVLFAGILLSSIIWVWLSSQILSEIYLQNSIYLEFLKATYMIRVLIGFFMIMLFALIGWLIYFIKEQLEEKSRANEIIRLARESELIHLRQQLQPHFLFNTLNSVNALINTDAAAAKKMILQLSDFLRGTLKKEDHRPVSFKEELNYLQLYLDIEKVRFGNRLNTIIQADSEASDKMVPVFLLQPLVENAIKFGLYDTIDEVTIEINAQFKDSYLLISIRNPFDVATSAAIPGTGFGLEAVSRRLFLLFNRNDLLEISSQNNLFTALLKIPQTHA